MVQEKKFKILIVNDSIQAIDGLMELLKSDYKVIAATNGERALMLARKEPEPDLILLDVDMPKMDGLEVCRRLKQEEDTCDIPVILTAEEKTQSIVHTGLELGARDLFMMPIDSMLLRVRLSNHLELEELRRANPSRESHDQNTKSETNGVTATKVSVLQEDITTKTVQRILVVEDNEIMLTVVQAMLERMGFLVSTATNGQQALELINHQRDYDVLVTDLNMPLVNGYKLLESLRAQGNNTPVIAMTASDVDLSPEQALRIGFADRLLKPFDEPTFIKVIEAINVKSVDTL